ncbi:MAG: VOC family protein [Candidatus Kapabacteria bacterium]|nr:VOC family protein [Candidatus Kapabacteria bacterium]
MRPFHVLSMIMLIVGALESSAQTTGGTIDLASATRIELASRDLLESLTWWARLGFAPIRRPGDRVDSALTLSDGQLVITLVRKSQPSPMIIFRVDDLESTKRILVAQGFRIEVETENGATREIRLRSPSSVFVTIRDRRIETDVRTTAELNPICGKLTELSTSIDTLSKEQTWWTKLGLRVARADDKPYSFVNMTSGFTEIGIHEARDIPSLAFTYFMPDMLNRINRLREQGLEAAELIPGPDSLPRNAIYVSPDGQLVYMFEGKR